MEKEFSRWLNVFKSTFAVQSDLDDSGNGDSSFRHLSSSFRTDVVRCLSASYTQVIPLGIKYLYGGYVNIKRTFV